MITWESITGREVGDILGLSALLTNAFFLFFSKNLMAVMYKIVEGDMPQLPDHAHPQLRTLFTRSVRSGE